MEEKTKFYIKYGKNKIFLSYEREEFNECWKPYFGVSVVNFEHVNADYL